MKRELITLGEFSNISGEMMVSDPCYKLGTWCQGIIKNVLVGQWRGFVMKSDEGDWGIRCGALFAVFESFKEKFLKDWARLEWEELKDIDVGVDSGQAGIFELKHYRDSKVITTVPNFQYGDDDDESALWYRACCDITLTRMGAGVLPFGVVSSSGYGDGGYTAYVKKDNTGMVVAIKIDFLGE